MSLTFHFLNAKLFFCLLVTLFQHHFAFATSNPIGLSLKAVLDDSPGSPVYLIENLTRAERIQRLINITKARANYLDLVLRPHARLVPDNIRIPIYREGLFYVIGFAIGSQRHEVKLIMDTGGGLIWTQCKPCKNCFQQRLGIYDRRASATYRFLPCNHPLCNGDSKLYNCVDGKCVYNVQYGGGASTRGVASFESFYFYINQNQAKPFKDVIFGCSDDSRDIVFQNTDISGVFGLNLSPDSMATQFSPTTRSRFSYCLVPFTDAVPRPLVLRFGEDIPKLPPQHVRTTMFLPPSTRGAYYYYLELLDISVANHRLGLPPDTFRVRPNGLGGCIIDSGALYTAIDTDTPGVNAYAAVMQAFKDYYGSRKLKRTTKGSLGFELCYEIPPRYNDFASLTYHFKGADYTIAGQYVHDFNPGLFCVGIIKGTFGTLLGAWHQQNKRLIYDVGIGGLQFADEQCINDFP